MSISITIDNLLHSIKCVILRHLFISINFLCGIAMVHIHMGYIIQVAFFILNGLLIVETIKPTKPKGKGNSNYSTITL